MLDLLDLASYFALTETPTPSTPAAVLAGLASDRLISPDVGGRWNIHNLGAILFAKDLRRFESRLARKAVRGTPIRNGKPLFPPVAVRELAANALIHQDMTLTGAGPTIELFRNRLEITNPGAPLVETVRFIDSPPRSRNEALLLHWLTNI